VALAAAGVPPTAANRPLRIDREVTMLFRASIVWILPLMNVRS
jgi:hypothetical protein